MPTKIRMRQPARMPRGLKKILLISGQRRLRLLGPRFETVRGRANRTQRFDRYLNTEVDRWRNQAFALTILVAGSMTVIAIYQQLPAFCTMAASPSTPAIAQSSAGH
jgi:hypothetical protein